MLFSNMSCPDLLNVSSTSCLEVSLVTWAGFLENIGLSKLGLQGDLKVLGHYMKNDTPVLIFDQIKFFLKSL